MTNKIYCLFLAFIFLAFMGSQRSISQTASNEEPIIKLGEISFQVKKIESTPSPLSILEFYVEVLNKSRKATAPPNSIKVVVSQKEVVFADTKTSEEYSPPSQEASLATPLPPLTGRVLIFGCPIPKEKVEFIAFDIQVNPPDGDKKTMKWEDR